MCVMGIYGKNMSPNILYRWLGILSTQKLSDFYSKLLEPDLSEISIFRKLFKAIKELNIENKEWILNLSNSVYQQNTEEFKRLVSLINS